MLPSVSAAFLVPRPGDAKPSPAALIDFTAARSVADLNRLLYDGVAAAGYAGGTAMESFATISLPVHLPPEVSRLMGRDPRPGATVRLDTPTPVIAGRNLRGLAPASTSSQAFRRFGPLFSPCPAFASPTGYGGSGGADRTAEPLDIERLRSLLRTSTHVSDEGILVPTL